MRETVIDLLDDYDFTARGAANGREMSAQLEDWPCQLIVLDLKMPGEDGLSLLQRLRRKIEPDPKHPTLIRTERNAGYIFTPRVEWRQGPQSGSTPARAQHPPHPHH